MYGSGQNGCIGRIHPRFALRVRGSRSVGSEASRCKSKCSIQRPRARRKARGVHERYQFRTDVLYMRLTKRQYCGTTTDTLTYMYRKGGRRRAWM